MFYLTHSINVLCISKYILFVHICTYLYIPPVYISGKYCVTYSPFGTPIPNLFFVLFFAPKRWPLYTSLPSLFCWLVSNWVYPVRDNGKGLEGKREKSGSLLPLLWPHIPGGSCTLPHHSSCIRSLLQAPAPSAPSALGIYLKIGFLETHWVGEVNADGLLRNALWIHTYKERRRAGLARRRS